MNNAAEYDDDVFYFDKLNMSERRVNKIKRVLSSCLLLLSGYVVATLMHQLVLGLLCIAFGYQTGISFHYVTAAPYDYASWSTARVLIIYASPPLFCIAMGYALYFLGLQSTVAVNRMRLLFFWLHAGFVTVFLTQLLIIPMGTAPRYPTGFYQTFAIIATWLHLPAEIFIAATVLAMLLAILWGYLMAPELQRYAFSSRWMQTLSGKLQMAQQVYLYPVLLAIPFIIWFSNVKSFLPHVLLVFLLLLPWLGILIRYRRDMGLVRCNRADVLNRWPVVELALTLAVWTGAMVFFG